MGKFRTQTVVFFLGLILLIGSCSPSPDEESQKDIKALALGQWQDKKFGMFIHWGLYSIPAGIWKGQKIQYYAEQIMNHDRILPNDYESLLPLFNPIKFDPEKRSQ